MTIVPQFTPMVQDRWYQTEAEWALNDFLNTKPGNPAIGLPTGTGKSLVIAKFIRNLMFKYPRLRFALATHVKELVKQDATALRRVWSDAPLGICSAGLRQKVTGAPIVFGGIKTMLKRADLIGMRDVLLIDECHLLSPEEDTEYQKFIKALKHVNPWLRIVGFSATLFRAKEGSLTNPGGIITDVAYNMCTTEGFARLIADGFLSMVIPKETQTELDVSNVRVIGDDFAQGALEDAVIRDTYIALQEMCTLAYDRHCWLVFAAGIKHAEMCASILQGFGVSATCVHSKLTDAERDERIMWHRTGKVKALVGMHIFTTGYDMPPLDCIGDLQPTLSVVKHVQKNGRGTRPYDFSDPTQYMQGFDYRKDNCLVLDFARNTERLGPINDPHIREPYERKGGGVVPIRICDNRLENGLKCGTYNHARSLRCINCGFQFPYEVEIAKTASTAEIITTGKPIVEYRDVISVVYNLHQKPGSTEMLRASYMCVGETKAINEFVGFEHPMAYVRHRAHNWWKLRHWSEPPLTSRLACEKMRELRTPKRLRVFIKPNFKEVIGCEF